MPRSLRPHAVLGLLTVLAAGAVALGIVLAPSTPNLVVHNAAGQLMLASRVKIVLSSPTSSETETVDLRSANTAVVTLRDGGKLVRSQVLHGSTLQAEVYSPFKQLLSIDNFQPHSHFRFTGSFPSSDIVQSSPGGASAVRGRITTRVTVVDGNLLRLALGGTISTSAGTSHLAQTYCVASVGGSPLQSC